MKTVVILGAGNLAFHLTRAMLENTIHIRQVYNRTLEKAKKIGEANGIAYTNRISQLIKADLYIICSSDVAIEEISYDIPFDDALVVHTSGSMPINTLKGRYRKGVLYPLQTFSKNRPLDYSEIPFFIETENVQDEEALKKFAKKISNDVFVLNSEQRMRMHLAAVWVNNFVNHLYTIGQQTCEQNGLSFDLLRPLIEETTNKILDMQPKEAQTGPAKRNDQVVIDKHLTLIKDDKQRLIYQLISQSITKMYDEKL